MNCFVFRINYSDNFGKIRNQAINGILRQGWGAHGMTVDKTSSFEEFQKAWPFSTPHETYIRNKYRNIQLMLEMKDGDIVIIPKMHKDNEAIGKYFTIARCKQGGYSFDPLDGDFGHSVPVEIISSYSYNLNDLTRTISAKFKPYQKSVNRVFDEGFINAVNSIIKQQTENPAALQKSDSSPITALQQPTYESRLSYLKDIVSQINRWDSRQLEKIIQELFEKNGYVKIDGNRYDKNGGDIDLVFNPFVSKSLLEDIVNMSKNPLMSEIRVQAKKKTNKDTFDSEGVTQLEKSTGSEKAINILINLTSDFDEDTKTKAAEKGITLINGIDFASLLVRYGIEVSD